MAIKNIKCWLRPHYWSYYIGDSFKMMTIYDIRSEPVADIRYRQCKRCYKMQILIYSSFGIPSWWECVWREND